MPPFFIEDREEPYRAELVLWMEEHSGLIVGQEVFAPEDTEGAVARVLLAALERPLAGPTRQPDTIRVADTSLAEEVQAAVGDAIPVAVAPTPELDAVMESMLESMGEPDEDESYLEGGRIAPEAVAALFAAAEHLYRMAPWTVATDDQVLRMDIPALGVEGACVTIIGNLGESLGLLVFPSLASYEAFLEATEEPVRKGGRLDLGSGWLALDFERGADLPASMRREVAAHAWPVVEADAYPCVRRYDRDGTPPPLTERDLKIAAACATSFTAFFAQHRGLFEADAFEPVCESYFDRDDLEVRFTVPYEAFALFDVDEDPSQAPAPPARSERARVGRNAPCRCGSGRKYKKCCLARDEQERSAGRERDTHHDLDGALVLALQRFALEHFADAWHRFERDFFDALAVPELAIPWALYHYRVEGASVLDRYLEERGRGLSRAERTWLEAQRASWLTLWEVTEVEPGRSVTLRDLLTDETRCVQEATASQTLVVRDTLLGRVVDADGVSLLCGMYPRALPPLEAAEVVRRARGRLRRKRAVPVERLRDEGFGRYLIQRWEEAVEDLDEARAVPPELQNTDGDALLATTDHFTIAPGEKPAVEAELAALEGAEPPEPGEDPPVYVFLRPGDAQRESWDTTVIGHARVSDTSLQLETNSRERADALRERVEAACGEWIRHRAREHADPLSSKAAPAEPDLEPVPTSPAEERLILEFKQRHYADWVDHPLPALGGKTPREAARTAGGRGALDALLKDMEHHEQRSPGGAAFDFSQIRRELRIE